MRYFGNLCWLFVGVVVCLAQDPASLFEKAPPDVDEALRARITQFYQLHVDRKYRAADELVAQDSKDTFFAMEKARCRSFSIAKITYSDGFSKAVVMIGCDTDVVVPMAGPIAVKMPLRSEWNLVDGQWFWHVNPRVEEEVRTPMGVGTPGPPANREGQPRLPVGSVDLATVAGLVRADKTSVRFDASVSGSQQVVFTNGLPGPAWLSLGPTPLDSLTLKLDTGSLLASQSATLSIRYDPSPKSKPITSVVKLVVSPTQQVIPIEVQFSAPAAPPGGK